MELENLPDRERDEAEYIRINDQKKNISSSKITKAYHNQEFIRSSDARVIRILSEYLEPLQRLKKNEVKDTVVFYGSARIISESEAKDNLQRVKWQLTQSNALTPEQRADLLSLAEGKLHMSQYYEAARQLAYKLTKWSMSLEQNQRFIVCSGGGPGVMEAANRGAYEAGGNTLGLNISIPHEQFANPYISENMVFEFHYFFMRKFWFVYLAKGLVVFPGGFGTFDELFELLTLRQTEKISKPLCVVVYGKQFWENIVNFNALIEKGMIDKNDLKLFHLVDSVDEAFQILTRHFENEFVGKKKYWHW